MSASTTPKVSVCIGTYNRERYVRECIDSVLAQTRPPDEIVVVDDASTDGTLKILEEYGDKIRLIRRTENSGVCQITRNQATKASTGDLIAYLDSDDAWLPEKLEQQVAFMTQHPSLYLSHTYMEVMDEYSHGRGVRHEGVIPPTGECFGELIKQCFITISSVMVRRDIFDAVGYFDEDRFWRIGEDSEFFFRVAYRYPVGFIDQVLGRYRKSDAGITANNWTYLPRVLPIHEWLLKHPERWRNKVSRNQVVDVIMADCIENGMYWRYRGNHRHALYFSIRAIRYRPWSIPGWREWAKSTLSLIAASMRQP